jgi:hypothetical protein
LEVVKGSLKGLVKEGVKVNLNCLGCEVELVNEEAELDFI